MQQLPLSSQFNNAFTRNSSLPQNGDECENAKTFPLTDRIKAICQSLITLTLPYRDANGNTIQLWKAPTYGLIGSVINRWGQLQIIPSHKIINPLSSDVREDKLLERIGAIGLQRWSLVFNPIRLEVILWPDLIAAGNGDVGQVNIYQAKLNSKTLSAAAREHKGETVKFKDTGVMYDHRQKVDQNKQGLKVHIQKLEGKLNQPQSSLSAHEKGQLQAELSQSRRLLEYVNRAQSAFNYPAYRTGVNKVLHPDQKAQATWEKHKELFKGHQKGPDKGPDGGTPRGGKPPPSPGTGQFYETLQKTGLTKSYNSCHPDHPAPSKGNTGGEIGGVGCEIELIEGLFDTAESLFETEHSFFIPEFEGQQVPFTSQEMCQILQELAVGIFVHGTVPFFSLHFNEEAHLYPVIHPAYEHTLVGQVFSMLDYFMKGYLNGGVFKESFVKQWQQNPKQIEVNDSILQELINFKSYAEKNLSGNDQHYLSVRSILNVMKMTKLEEVEHKISEMAMEIIDDAYLKENQIFWDYTKFMNSFRIIAKQKGVYKTEGLFVLSTDFDVRCTVKPHPDYQLALEQHYKMRGSYPQAYDLLLEAYEEMKKKIHNHMVKMPFCRKYFAMLGVINFFSYYFMTLKKHRKVPILPNTTLEQAGSPALFPALPLLSAHKQTFNVNKFDLCQFLVKNHSDFLKEFLQDQAAPLQINQVEEKLAEQIRKQIYKNSSVPVQREIVNDKEKWQKGCQPVGFLNSIKTIYMMLEQQAAGKTGLRPKNERIQLFIEKILPEFFKDQTATPFLSATVDSFILPNEQSAEERELGKRVVGGCGMEISPLKVQLSPISQTILNHHWSMIQKTPPGEWAAVTSQNPAEPRGAIFTLSFCDLPFELEENKQELEKILTAGSGDSSMEQMVAILEAISGNQQPEFIELIQKIPLNNMTDREKRSLLHHSVMVADPFFTIELLKKGLSMNQGDHKTYLPIHYAAMCGHLSQLQILVQADPKSIFKTSNHGATPLIVALQYGQFKAAEYLIANGARGDEKLRDGYTALHCAVHQGNLSLVQLLLGQSQASATKMPVTTGWWAAILSTTTTSSSSTTAAMHSLNAITQEGITPLMIACQMESLSIVKFLLEMNADAKVIAKNGMTALEIAVKKNHVELCQLLAPHSSLSETTIETAVKKCSLDINILLTAFPDYLNYRNAVEDTPLLMAIRYANLPVAKHILSLIQGDIALINHQNKVEESAIRLAIKGKFYSCVEELLKKGAQISSFELFKLLLETNYYGQSSSINKMIDQHPLQEKELQALVLIAAQAGNPLAISELLLPKEVNLEKIEGPHGWKINHYLAKSDAIYLFKMRIRQSKDPQQPLQQEKGKTLAYIAGENGSWRVLSFLLDQAIPLTNHYQGRDLFYSVLERGEVEKVKKFVEKVNNPQLVNQAVDKMKGIFPIHLAAKIGSKEILAYLHSCGANLNIVDHEGHSALFHAIQNSTGDVIEFLLDEKHPISITAEDIYEAAASFNQNILFMLIKKGVNLNENNQGQTGTALFKAIGKRDMRTSMRLIQDGASLSYQDEKGWTPFLLCAQEGLLECMQVILSKHPFVKEEKIKGSTALHIACKQGHEHCVRFLVENGFLKDEKNELGETPVLLAKNHCAVSAELGMVSQKQQYEQLTQMLYAAVTKQDILPILDSFQQWPLNTYFTLNLRAIGMRGTLLHLILSLCEKCEGMEELIDCAVKKTGFDPHLKDGNGNTYAHLLVHNHIDPGKYSIFDLETMNHQGQTPLHGAAVLEETASLKALMKRLGAAKIDPVDHAGNTPLFHAIEANKLEQVKLLIEQGANLEHRNCLGLTPLIFACGKGNYPIVRTLVERGANINQKGRGSLTPLSVSILAEHEDIPLFLLFNGAQLSSVHIEGKQIGHLAAARGKNFILRFLAEQGILLSSLDDNGLQPIHHAAIKGKINTLNFLMSQGISIDAQIENVEVNKKGMQNKQGVTPLLLAAMQGTLDTVEWLLHREANVEKTTHRNLNILMSCLENRPANCCDLIRFLQEYRLIDDLRQILPALSMAIARDYLEPLKLLYGMGIPISSKLDYGFTGLHYACRFGSLHATEFLLSQGANADILSDSGELPIELAVINSSPEQFRLMLNFTQVLPDHRNQKGQTLMHLAVLSGNLAHVMILIDQGADFDKQDSQGQTPLYIAAQKGFQGIVNLLMICGANPDLKTSFNALKPEDAANEEIRACIQKLHAIRKTTPKDSTPLHIAVRAGYPLALRLLVRHFDVNKKNSLGKTALNLAMEAGNQEMSRILLEHGAESG